jgi:hypothetical protein
MRTYDLEKVRTAVSQYADQIVGLNVEEWLGNPKNIALINGNDDVALFEHQHFLTDTVCGHYFFFSRGKEALKAGRLFLREIFSGRYYVQTIVGITPEDHKGALWMNKQLGFKDNGSLETMIGPCRFVSLTREQWKDNN